MSVNVRLIVFAMMSKLLNVQTIVIEHKITIIGNVHLCLLISMVNAYVRILNIF